MDSEYDIDNIIDQLLSVRGARPGRQVNLTEGEIVYLCKKGREVFTQQPVLLELEAPIKVRCYLVLILHIVASSFFSIFWNYFLHVLCISMVNCSRFESC
jgi:hypothetical protein